LPGRLLREDLADRPDEDVRKDLAAVRRAMIFSSSTI
jgi:hypothetical protein